MIDKDKTKEQLINELKELRHRIMELEALEIERRQAEEMLRNALEELRQREAEISALLESSRAILKYQKFQDIAQTIFDSCKNVVGAAAGYFALLGKDDTQNNILFLDSGGVPCTVDPSLPMPIRGSREVAYSTGKTVYYNDFSKSERAKYMPAGHLSLENVLFAPLVIKGKTVGLLSIANKPKGFTENDARIASVFSELAAIALFNSQTLESLEASEERFRSVIETANDAIISFDAKGNITFWNQAAKTIFGYSAAEIVGKPLTLIIPERFREAYIKGMQKVALTGKSNLVGKALEVSGIRKDGKEFPLELSLSTWRTKERIFYTGVARDITERKQIEEELWKRTYDLNIRVKELDCLYAIFNLVEREDISLEEILQGVISIIPSAWQYPEITCARIILADQTFQTINFKETIWKQASDIIVFGYRIGTLEVCYLEEKPDSYEGPFLREERNLINIIAELLGEIITRKRMKEALIAEKERLDVTLRSIGDGVIATDTRGKIVLINKVAENLTGWTQEAAIGKPLAEVFYIINEKTRERCENPVDKVIEKGIVVGLANNTVLVAKDGTERIIADSGAPIHDKHGNIIGVVLVFRDITEKRKMEEELQKAQKLESVGILAGGIAHDFNNILTAIWGNISLAKMYVSPKDKVFERLTEAEKASLRARDLTQQLLTFSKGGAPIKKTTSLIELIKDSASFALRGSNVRCEFSLPEGLWPVEIDEGQISQVIHNMIINADQAMPEGGVIKVNAENISIEAEEGLPLQDGEYVKIAIKDHGIGIPEEHLPKIFDPYFTTKQKGSGLGLTTSYSIIKNHDGYINVESKLGVGTTFQIYLPASQKAILTMREPEEKIIAGRGKILVMDDEEAVRDIIGQMLSYIGYDMEFASEGSEAVERYIMAKETGQPFDAVILDLTVPGGLGGKKTMEKLLDIDPHIKAIVSSGYSNDPIMADFRKYGFSGVIVKPYKIKELSEVLHEVLKIQR